MTRPMLTKEMFTENLQRLGLSPGDSLYIHTDPIKAAWLVGGPDIILDAATRIVGTNGTLTTFCGWENASVFMNIEKLSEEVKKMYIDHCPAFHIKLSRGETSYNPMNEIMRSRQGSFRSAHPQASFVSLGSKARLITEKQPASYPYGKNSPLERLFNSDAKVLLFGSDIEMLPVFFYSESVCQADKKITRKYKIPVQNKGKKEWLTIEDIDIQNGITTDHKKYRSLIFQNFLESGHVRGIRLGNADCYLFDMATLHDFTVDWIKYNIK
ncbi:MAG: AAC(3) family N-acetyltransferase [Candidatus Muiribacteriaceae bacterium]